MKLRCTPNSIRIRIRKTALQTLENASRVEGTILFPNGQKLIYGLEIREEVGALQAHFQDGVIMIYIPTDMAQNWIGTDLVGLETAQGLPNGQQLQLLIEKDFPCRHQTPEENTDTFRELAAK